MDMLRCMLQGLLCRRHIGIEIGPVVMTLSLLRLLKILMPCRQSLVGLQRWSS